MTHPDPAPPSAPATDAAPLPPRAAFLHERTPPAAGAPLGAEALDEARERAERWRVATMLDPDAWERRLAWAGTDPESLVRTLAAGDALPRDGVRDEEWRAFVRGMAAGGIAAEPVPSVGEMQPGLPDDAFLPMGSFLLPFVRFALLRIRARGIEPSPRVRADLAYSLFERLSARAMPVLTLELNVARLMEELPGDTSEARFRFFSERRYRDPETFAAALDEYAVLARLLAGMAARAGDAAAELLERLRDDRAAIAERFADGTDPGEVVELRTGASDSHHRGRTVATLRFASGLRLVYKPVSLAVDARFHDLLRRVNAAGLRLEHRTIRVLDRGGHGWMDFVEAAPCPDRGAAERFWWREGSLLALLHLLLATDFHHENLIAAGEHPVLVDLEGLLHHDAEPVTGTDARSRARAAVRESVLRSGLLPLIVSGRDGTVDLGGMGGQAGQRMDDVAMELAGGVGDEMRLQAGAATLKGAVNLPTVDGVVAPAAEFADAIALGFRETWDALAAARGEVEAAVRGFAGCRVRHLLRDTRHYTRFLVAGAHPDEMRDALSWDELLDRLWAETTVRPVLTRVVPSEIEDLRRGDVPAFHALPGSTDLRDAEERVLPGFFPRPSLDAATERIARMEPGERDGQTRLVRMALLAASPAPCLLDPAPPPPFDGGVVLAGAVRVGEWLRDTAVRGTGEAWWIGLDAAGDDPGGSRRGLAPVTADLYEGAGGIVLFLARLAAVTGRCDLEETARLGLAAARAEMARAGAPGTAMAGAFAGRGGHARLLADLSALWGEPALLDAALEEVEPLERIVPGDALLDVLGGAAGCAVVALDLHRLTGEDRLLRLARRCGERLLETARAAPGGACWLSHGSSEPFPGFSHGAAGIAWALLRVARATGDERFRRAALAGIGWERATFDPHGGKWFQSPVAWCHGPLSVGLGRFLCMDLLDDPAIGAEVEAGVAWARERGSGASFSLCHGAMGNADLLLTMGRRLGRPRWEAAARAWASAVAPATEALADLSALPAFARSPGLMCGAAGVGYALLRIALPDRVPSVLVPTVAGA